MTNQQTLRQSNEPLPLDPIPMVRAASPPEASDEGAPPLRAPDRLSARRPRIVVVGEAHHTRPVRESLSDLPMELVETADLGSALEGGLAPDTVAVILALPLRGFVAEHAVARIAEQQKPQLHVLVIVPGGYPDSRANSLYEAGATGVLSWSTDADRLDEVITNLIAEPPRENADHSLARTIRARLWTLLEGEDRARLSTHGGGVRLIGRVRNLWKRRRLVSKVEQMPGVARVDARDLDVENSGLADDRIAAAVRELLRGASSIDDRTLAVSVHAGRVVLQGTVVAHEEWNHALELISRVEGVRSVANRTVEAPRRKRRERAVARRLRRTASRQLESPHDLNIAVIGRTAVLRGWVRKRSARADAEQLAHADKAVDRVVNKLQLA